MFSWYNSLILTSPLSFSHLNYRGDAVVGTSNEGVNGGLNGTGAKSLRSGLAIELGSGSLDKTRHLLRSVAKLLNGKDCSSGEAALDQIEYRAVSLV